MEEDEYRSAYKKIVEIPCPFEKAILSNHCSCQNEKRLHIAERHASGCQSEIAQKLCLRVLATLREKAKFSLRMASITGGLPHGKELKVQAGGMKGILKSLHPEEDTLSNLFGLILEANKAYGDVEQYPFQEIIPYIAKFEGRPKRRKKK